ncbi:MAG: DUF3617 family protein [Pseudomonadota bacterium]|nr:DUF3617 family protein [Pseudomonadota bacterium]
MRQPSRYLPACAGLLLIALTPAVADEMPLPAGLWRIQTTMESSLPMLNRQQTQEQCVAPDESFNPAQMTQGLECSMLESSRQGDRLDWQAKCASQGMEMDTVGHVIVRGNTASSEMTMQASGPMPVTMTVTSEGKRIGDC